MAYSAAPGQVAADGRGGNSPYTAALARAMREPGLDLLKVFQRTRIAVLTTTAGAQTPWEEQSLLGDFYFLPQDPTVTTPAPGTPAAALGFDERAMELTFWESVKDSADPADFEDYLARYPDGAFSGLAKRRLAALLPERPARRGQRRTGAFGPAGRASPALKCPPPAQRDFDPAVGHCSRKA